MLKNIANTIGTKLLLQGINFGLIILTSQVLGDEGRGEISFFIANLTLVVLFAQLIGGPALVYLTPRSNPFRLLVPTYAWTVLSCIGGSYTLFLLGKVAADHVFDLVALAILFNLWGVNLFVIQGYERIKLHNAIALSQVVILMGTLLVFFFGLKTPTTRAYIDSLYFSFGITFFMSFLALFTLGKAAEYIPWSKAFLQATTYGFMGQMGNIVMFFSYRLTYYFIPDLGKLGVYSVAIQLSEALWILARSLAMVQYPRISNAKNERYKGKLTTRLLKTNFLLTSLGLGFVLLLPSNLYTFLFGPEFTGVRNYLLWLCPGVLAIAMNSTISPYFGGKGKYSETLIAAAVGFVFTLGGCLFLVPEIGPKGAAITSSIAYAMITIFLLIRFKRYTDFQWRELWVRKSELVLIWRIVKRKLRS